MANNSFGKHFRITTWGESHGKAIGVVIDGCPAGYSLCEDDFIEPMTLRAPGRTPYVTPRKEEDRVEILSGVFEGKTTGHPISLLIWNQNYDSSKYEPIKEIYRPGHSNYTYLEKYGIFDYRGGGRASARETACRVAAGVVAQKILDPFGITPHAALREMGGVVGEVDWADESIDQKIISSPLFCGNSCSEEAMKRALKDAIDQGNSLGGVVEVNVANMPVGLGDPVYEKLEANLAKAMMSIPATKGFEMGDGFTCTRVGGKANNDLFSNINGKISFDSNHSGGTLGGISNGMPLTFRVAVKPTSSIHQPQMSVKRDGSEVQFELPKGSKHDPCVAIRAVPVIKSMTQLVLADALLSYVLNKEMAWNRKLKTSLNSSTV